MAFWYGVIGVVVASVVVFFALSINGKTKAPEGHDSHGHGDGHGHGHH
jgi:hypothetical protein